MSHDLTEVLNGSLWLLGGGRLGGWTKKGGVCGKEKGGGLTGEGEGLIGYSKSLSLKWLWLEPQLSTLMVPNKENSGPNLRITYL